MVARADVLPWFLRAFTFSYVIKIILTSINNEWALLDYSTSYQRRSRIYYTINIKFTLDPF